MAAAEARDYDEAKRIAVDLTGKKISKQAWYLLPKMLDVVEHWRSQPDRIREVHPECSFRAMRGDAARVEQEDLERASRSGCASCATTGSTWSPGTTMRTDVAPDDVVDAAAVAWTAHRIAQR